MIKNNVAIFSQGIRSSEVESIRDNVSNTKQCKTRLAVFKNPPHIIKVSSYRVNAFSFCLIFVYPFKVTNRICEHISF